MILTVLREEYEAVLGCLAAPGLLFGSEGAPNTYAWQLGAIDSPRYGATSPWPPTTPPSRDSTSASPPGRLARTRPAGGALSSLFRHPGLEIVGGLTADHTIEQRTETGGQAAARAAVLSAKIVERDAQAKLAVRATRAVQRARAALASIALGDTAISLAEQNVAAEQKRFELGKSTNFDVLRRQDELEQARLRQASAVADYLAASADLDGLSGAILAHYRIVMP